MPPFGSIATTMSDAFPIPATPQEFWRIFEASLALHQAGDTDRAELGYRNLLLRLPLHPDTNHLLGIIHVGRGELEEGHTLIERAIARAPDTAVYHANRSLALRELGRYGEAAEAARRSIELDPNAVEGFVNLAEALRCTRDYVEAEAHARQALTVAPDSITAALSLAAVLISAEKFDEALGLSERARSVAPNEPTSRLTLGHVLSALDRIDEAEAEYRAALALSTDYSSLFNLSLLLAGKCKNREPEAEELARRAIALRPRLPMAYVLLGNVIAQTGRIAEAVEWHTKAAELRPDDFDAHVNLAACLQNLRRNDEAIASYRRAIEIRPDNAAAHYRLSLALLSRGIFTDAWHEFTWHRRTKGAALGAYRTYDGVPEWRGETPEPGQTLLIYPELALGDTLLAARWAPEAAERGWRVVFQVDRSLVRLLRQLPAVRVISTDVPPPPFDMYVPTFGLPLALGTVVTAIPRPEGYLTAPAVEVETWRGRLDAADPGCRLRVGLCWAGAGRPHDPALAAMDAKRSVDPELLRPVVELPGIAFVSLQKGGVLPPPDFDLIDWSDDLLDFGDTAALIEALDLVVSVDTSVANLAGALGKPTLLMDRYDSDWRYGEGQETSPFYISVRVYRQTLQGEWAPVLRRIEAELRKMVEDRAKDPPTVMVSGAAGAPPALLAVPVAPAAPAGSRVPSIEEMPAFQTHNHLIGNVEALDGIFRDAGYLFFRNVLDVGAIARLRKHYVDELARIGALDDPAAAMDGFVSWNGKPVDAFALDSVGPGAPWRDFAADPSVNALLASLLGKPAEWCGGLDYRAVAPRHDAACRLSSVHQDGPYMPYPVRILWVPVAPIDADVGGIALAECMAQKRNLHRPGLDHNAGIDPATLPTDRWRRSDFEPGDLLMLNPWTPHSGLSNVTTDRLRLSLDIRIIEPKA